MIYITYNDKTEVSTCSGIFRPDEHHIALTFSDDVTLDTSGFTFSIYPSGLPVCGDYRTFTTLYSVINKTVTYSDNNSICIVLDVSALSVIVGSTGKITATCDGTPTWVSSDTSVATVDSDGIVTGVAAGTATITASYGGITATCTVTVA